MLPNFIIIGVAKCGTTTLCDTLMEHPDIFFSKPKEPNYFNKIIHYESTRDDYEKIFENAGNSPIRGEGSVGYTNPNRIHFVPKRIHEVIPDCKLIYMVRHPIKRLESDWKMRLRLGNKIQNFNDSLEWDMSLYNHGLYWNTLSHYLKYFKKEQILIVFIEDLFKSFDVEILRILNHIGADTDYKLSLTHSNSAENYREDTRFSTFLKKIVNDNLKAHIPDFLKHRFRHLITKEWDYDIDWDPQVFKDVTRIFAEDSKALLEYCGKSKDFWDFSLTDRE